MATYKKKKISFKSIISLILVIGTVIALGAGVSALLNKETKSFNYTLFSVGGIDSEGNHVETKTSIYTKELFECQGLTIEPDFEAKGTYQVFYYGENKDFLGSTEVMSCDASAYAKGSSFLLAKYARIMITPEVEEEKGKEFKIAFYEVYGIARDYKIELSKTQNFDTLEYLEESTNYFSPISETITNGYGETGNFSPNATSEQYFFNYVTTAEKQHLYIKAPVEILSTLVNAGDDNYINVPVVYPVNKNLDNTYTLLHDGVVRSAQVYNDGETVVFMYDLNSPSHVFGFLDEASFNSGEIGIYVD